MIKQPLFGQDSSPHKTSTFMGGLITVFIWLVLTLTGVFVKLPSPTPKYKEVQIVLATTPIEEKTQAEESAAAAAAVPEEQTAVPEEQTAVTEPVEVPEIPNPVETPVVQAKVEAPKANPAPAKTQTPPKTAAKQNTAPKVNETPADKKVQEYQSYGKTVEELMEEQFNKKTYSTKDIDDIFANMGNLEPEINENKASGKVLEKSRSSAESAGVISKEDSTPKTGGGKQNTSEKSEEVSEDTRKYLADIARAQPYAKTSGGIESKIVAETVNSSGKTNVKMSNGKTRALLQPANPYISLPPDIAALVKEQKVTVSITIVVIPSGNVPRVNIDISPKSTLPLEVQEEICNQLSSWLFDSEPDGVNASATFEYTIKKN